MSENVDVHDVGADILWHELDVEESSIIGQTKNGLKIAVIEKQI